jgi:lipid II:glycine glycyltransferase (peptidoglycan interpeptide bridge formation enzyme)
MTEPQQSPLFAQYIQALKWQVIQIDGVYIFIKKFGLFGGMMKIHRPLTLPAVEKILPLLKKYSIKTVIIEPVETQSQQELDSWCQKMSKYVHINTSPYLPTKTERINLKPTEETIFDSFSEAKRRAVRRSIKAGVQIRESKNIEDLIIIKNTSAGLFGFITTTGIKELWQIFTPKNATILLACDAHQKIVGGVLLIHWDHMSYYWIAGATKYGKKLFAPTYLVWESLKIAKYRKSTWFDFVGVWDERIPRQNTQWKGFTKFKEGFGGTQIYYPLIPRD